jgi:A/G-specific adenine glycosylase
MLQQTQVATVISYYKAWLKRFPTVQALAAASEDDVLHAWQGLGYYSRARRLRQGAQYILAENAARLPRTPEAWLKVPGVGRYTAGAITSIAFGSMAPVLDGNVVRVLCRLLALAGNPTRAPLAGALWQHAEALLVPERPGDINQALMELGATVCTPRAPSCSVCPWVEHCRAYADGAIERYPELPARPKPTEVTMAATVVNQHGRVLLYQQPKAAARWASMWLFPCMEVRSARAATRSLEQHLKRSAGLDVAVGEKLGVFKHAVTRFRITLHSYYAGLKQPRARRAPPGFMWVKPDALDDYALPAVHRRIARELGV